VRRRLLRREHRRRAFVAVGVVYAALGLLAYATDAMRDLELDTVDTRFAVRGVVAPPADLVVVQVDDVTFGDFDETWPLPRSRHAELIDHLRRDGARTIAYDVQFTEPTELREDNALIRAVRRARPVVLATTEVDERGESGIFGGEETLREIGARSANALIPPDADGRLRHFPYAVDGLESFAVVTVETREGRQVDPGELDGREAWIDYHGPPGTIPAVSFSKATERPAGFFRGKTVVIGASAPSVGDVHATPFLGDGLMSGPEVQASAISSLRRGMPLREAPPIVDGTIVVAAALVPALAALVLSGTAALAVTLLAAAGYLGLAQLLFEGGVIVTVVYPLLACALAALGTLAVTQLFAQSERERVRERFARFVPEQVVDEVLECADDDLRLGGVRRRGTVMFCDLRGFTTFAETLPPDQVIDALNHYLTEMSAAILGHGGTLVSYMGDGIMAVFGAPIEQDDHADRALAAAREMVTERLPRFNEWLRHEGLAEGFRMGIGLNSGAVMSGNVGSQRRMEYTAVGDATNTAARLEGMTKGTPHQLYVAESTRAQLRHDVPDLVRVGELPVRGREHPIRVWTLDGAGGEASTHPPG
jgi:adenylate cyclase